MKESTPMSSIAESNLLRKKSYLVFKRIFDVVFSFLLLVVLTPFLLLLNLILLIVDGSPVTFTQNRIGQKGIPFKIYKYRTMKPVMKKQSKNKYQWTNGVPDNFVFKSSSSTHDFTKLGLFLRKTSLDEILQLVNVIKGDMSIIGPRPEIPEIANCYNDEQKKRLLLKPGITGLAQVKGRSDITHGEKIKFDLYYIENCSLKLDIKIILLTVKQVFLRKGAY